MLGGGFGTGECKNLYPYSRRMTSSFYDIYFDDEGPFYDDSMGVARSKLKHGGFFDAATRFGYVIGCALPFVKVGWGMHHYTLHYDFPGNIPKSKWFNCVTVGVGIDVTVQKNILIGLVSDVDFCAKMKFKVSTMFDPEDTLSVRPRNVRGMVTCKYKFLTDEAPAASPESETLAFQSGAYTELGVGLEVCGSVNHRSGPISALQNPVVRGLFPDGLGGYWVRYTTQESMRDLKNKANFGKQGFTGGLHFGYDCRLRDRPITLGVLLGGGFGTGECKNFYTDSRRMTSSVTALMYDPPRTEGPFYDDSGYE